MGKVATSPLAPWGSPPLQSGGGQNQKRPTSGQGGYITPAASGIPTAALRGSPPLQSGGPDQKWPINGQGGYITPGALGIPTASKWGGAKSEAAHKWARWLHNPCRLRGSPPLQSGGPDQKWPINGQGGCITTAASGIATASERGAKSEVAHTWAMWLHHPCRLGDPHGFRAGGEIRRGP